MLGRDEVAVQRHIRARLASTKAGARVLPKGLRDERRAGGTSSDTEGPVALQRWDTHDRLVLVGCAAQGGDPAAGRAGGLALGAEVLQGLGQGPLWPGQPGPGRLGARRAWHRAPSVAPRMAGLA